MQIACCGGKIQANDHFREPTISLQLAQLRDPNIELSGQS